MKTKSITDMNEELGMPLSIGRAIEQIERFGFNYNCTAIEQSNTDFCWRFIKEKLRRNCPHRAQISSSTGEINCHDCGARGKQTIDWIEE